jgi:hypothetical protein
MMETGSEFLVKEQGRLRHDQVSLELVGSVSAARTIVGIDSDVRVGKCKITIGDIGGVARFVVPRLEVRDLGASDTQQNSQDLQVSYLLGESRVQTAAALFNKREVESRRVRDGLQVVGDVATAIEGEIAVIERDSRMLSLRKIRNGLFESAAEIGVGGSAAETRPPRSVHRQLLQVGKPPLMRHSCYLAWRQNSKFAQVNGLGAFRRKIVVEKAVVANLVVSVVRDVLRHVAVEHKSRDVIRRQPRIDFLTVQFQVDWRKPLIGRAVSSAY